MLIVINERVIKKDKRGYLMWLIIAVIFVLLMGLGTFFDYDISKWMTKNSLNSGEYYTHNIFAQVMETIGSFPIWLALCFAFALLFWLVKYDNMPIWARTVFAVCLFAAGVFVAYMFMADASKYLMEQNGVDYLVNLTSIVLTNVVLALIIASLVFLLSKNFNADKKKLLGLAMVILCTAALYFIVTLIKTPWGRARFRTISFLGDQSLYTPWYVINGSRSFEFLPYDCCKSFPSGHTFSGGLVFVLLCLPSVFTQFNTKKTKLTLWIITVSYTAIVALSRIIAGAHYLTDVTFGGFLALVGVLTFKRIFLDVNKRKTENMTNFDKKAA